MALSFTFAIFFKEEEKVNISEKEEKFRDFFANSVRLFKSDKYLRIQILSRLFAYAFWFIVPFIILNAKEKIGITGKDVGFIISLQMGGAMLSNLIWARLSTNGKNKHIVIISFILMISAIFLSLLANHIYFYYLIFFIAGAGIDGFRLSFSNLILIIAPEDKRPVYVAVQNNITSIGMFFSIPGGILVSSFSYNFTAIFTISLLIIGFFYSFRLKRA